MLKRFFQPDAYFRSLADIDFNSLYEQGYRLVLLDMDNTLIRDGHRERTAFSDLQINRMLDAGFKCLILSNGPAERVKPFADLHHLDFIADSGKPSRRGVHLACQKFSLSPKETLLIGDQIFTDVLCGRRSGVLTLLVAPLATGEKWYIRIKRIFELPFISSLKMNKGLPSSERKIFANWLARRRFENLRRFLPRRRLRTLPHRKNIFSRLLKRRHYHFFYLKKPADYHISNG